MAAKIFQAANDSWTSEQQQFKRDLLANCLSMGTAPKSSTQIQKTEIAENAAKAADKAAKQAEKAAVEAERCAEEERNLSGWFDECVILEPASCVKQAVWYPDYRAWADRANVAPLNETAAVATLKRVHQEVSVGQKTYGIKLRSMEAERKPVPFMSMWLISLIRSEIPVSSVDATTLRSRYIEWCQTQEPPVPDAVIKAINKTSFGKSIQKYSGADRTKSRDGSFYTFDVPVLRQYLVDLGHHQEEQA